MLSTGDKNTVLLRMAELLDTHRAEILSANAEDLEAASTLDATLRDRLAVNDKKIDGMMASIREVAAADDPVGTELSSYVHPNGLRISNKTVPFGKILIIYESRPDVTIEAAASAFKAGNYIVLKGGKESVKTNLKLVSLWHYALQSAGLAPDYVSYLNLSREETQALLRENRLRLDLIIPRGGESLIDFVKKNTDVPVLVSGRGNNFVYVNPDADFDMAISIIINGKSRLSVCNATDKVLINRFLPQPLVFLRRLIFAAEEAGLHVLVDQEMHHHFSHLETISNDAIWSEEFLSEKILFGFTDSLEHAIATINNYSGGHSASIITHNLSDAAIFQDLVDCAAVYHNASTRFTDGGEFGMGAEMAISTQKLHFRGPVGLGQLVTNKWLISGNGQIR